ncbi:hypothetical protein [Labrys neptuniae]
MAAREGWHNAQGRAFGGPLKYIERDAIIALDAFTSQLFGTEGQAR